MDNQERKRGGPERFLYSFLAIVVAVGIWFYVDSYGNNGSAYLARQKITDIPIEYTGLNSLAENGLMLSYGDETSESVDLTFEGARTLVCQLDRSRIRVSANLGNITSPGTQTVQYTVSYLNEEGRATIAAGQHFARVNRVDWSIENATVQISEMTRKEVDIRCELVGNVAEGYSAGQIQLSQNTVELQGLEEELSKVSYAKVTLDVGPEAKETTTRRLTCQFYDESDELIEDYHFRATTAQITVTLPVSLTKDLNLIVEFLEAPGAKKNNISYKIEPEFVTVSGEAANLENVSEIILGEQNLLDLVGAEGRVIHTYSIEIPEGCQNESGVTRATMQIAFKDMAFRDVETENFVIDAAQLSDGKTAEVLTESLTVSVFGASASVDAVTESNLIVTPRLKDFAAASGVVTVPAQVSVRNGPDVGIMGDYEVQVRIRESVD